MADSLTLFVDRIYDGERFRSEPLCIDVEAGRIQHVRPRSAGEQLSEGTLDARGSVVVPGLIDAHTHIARAGQFEAEEPPNPGAILHNLRSALAAGVTTVGDMGCTAPMIRALRAHTAKNPHAGPTIRGSGPLLADPLGYPLDWLSPFHKRLRVAIPCTDERSARRAVEELARLGMDHVKICIMHQGYGLAPLSVFSRSVARALVAEARALGLRVFAHAHWNADYRLALDAGVDALMHSSFDALDAETLARVRDSGVPVCPTLWVFHSACIGLPERWDRDAERARRVVPAVRRSWARFAEAYAVSGDIVPDGIASGLPKERAREGVRNAIANLRLLHDAGVPFAFGSDGPYGFSTVGRPSDELGTWQDAGLDPVTCLHAATRGAAELLGLSDRGSIRPGARADLVVLGADPEADVNALSEVRAVVHAGTVVRAASRLATYAAIGRGFAGTLRTALEPVGAPLQEA